MKKRVFFYVQALLGIGHQRRAASVARALQEVGAHVIFVTGTFPMLDLDLGGAQLVQLPPVRAIDSSFEFLLDENSTRIDEAWRANRRESLLAAFEESDPHVVIIEMFPFGRRQMSFELLPLLEKMQKSIKRPIVVSSVRDILVEPKNVNVSFQILSHLQVYFDYILVHGDPDLVPFGRTFPYTDKITKRLYYTGYVVDTTGRRGAPGDDGWSEVLVSAGSGAVGRHLLRVAIEAKPLTKFSDLTWRVLAGVNSAIGAYKELKNAAPPGVIVERYRDDFPTLLMNCSLSISQGGYNTIMESIRAGCRTIVVPYSAGNETEQSLRADLLEELGVLSTLAETNLDPITLASLIDRVFSMKERTIPSFNLEGATTTAKLVVNWANSREW